MSNFLELFSKSEEKMIPIVGLLELTYKCNLKCLHCYIIDDYQEKELSAGQIKEILSQLAEAGCLILTITGGEPLLRNDFWEIAAFARDLGFALVLKTNATLISREAAKQLKELNFYRIDISLYGVSNDVHDGITNNKNSYQKTRVAIEYLIEEGLTVQLNVFLMKKNQLELLEIIKQSREMGTGLSFDYTISPKNDGSTGPLIQQLSEKELIRVMEVLESEKIDVTSCPQIAPNSNICAIGRRTFSITPYGNVYPCLQYPQEAGNLLKDDFATIWRESKLLNKIRKWKLEDLHICSSCRDIDYCLPCLGLAYLEGDPLGSYSGSCLAARARRHNLTVD